MRLKIALVLALLPAGCLLASAQSVEVKCRPSVAIDKKVAKGLTVGLEEQARFDSDGFDRLHSDLSLGWKICDFLKSDAGYVFILKPSDLRHRPYVSLAGSLKSGPWYFSLKEKFQLTCRVKEDMNLFQQPRCKAELKSRVKASYKARTTPLEPYAAFEARLLLNGVDETTLATKGASDLSAVQYTDTYFNRLRGILGVEWQLSRSSFLDFYSMADYCIDKVIDASSMTNAKHPGKLKSVNMETEWDIIFGVVYRFRIK